jgi:nicotinate-nucleotide adenylyltransferase
MKIGLFFGSFNPIHIGHLIIASFVADNTDLQQIWFVVSPQNPLKPASMLLNEYQRLYMVQLAVDNDKRFKVSDIEFKLPKPSFTIDTLIHLEEKYPEHQFSVIMGSDSFQNIHRWKNFENLVKRYSIIIYLRPGFAVQESDKQKHLILKAPMLDIAATDIRMAIKENKSIQYLVPEKVKEEIEKSNYYK